MTVAAVIFSRLDSQRLPGKALKPFAGRPLLGHVIDRALAAKGPNMVIVATSDRPTDDPIAEYAAREGARVFRGSALDVLGRGLACAEAYGLTVLGRICGDSPFIDPDLIDRMLAVHEEVGVEVTTNLFPRTFPAGMSFEVIEIEALRRLADLTDDATHREHMTTFIYAHPENFRIHNVTSGIDGSEKVPLTVDSADDLVQANWLIRRLRESNKSMTLDNVLALAREWRATNPVENKGRVL
ncbi:MAG: NTP transferase domain-containing protein [Rhodospirillales bacterium]|nr:NTP transferase domain-containing protein [Rhodospirillales bacterium]